VLPLIYKPVLLLLCRQVLQHGSWTVEVINALNNKLSASKSVVIVCELALSVAVQPLVSTNCYFLVQQF
jgi:hypothetical protein